MKKIWKWLRANLINKQMFVFTCIGELIFWSPVIVAAILALVINPWYWTAVSAIIIFWAGPFTPAVPLQIALIFGLKKLYDLIRRKKNARTRNQTRTDTKNIIL